MPESRSQSAPALLLIAGSDQDERLVTGSEAVPTTGNTDLHRLIAPGTPFYRLHVTRKYFQQAPSRPNLHPFRTALNLVTDPDQNPKVLANVQKLLRDFPGMVVNRPGPVLRSTRDQVAKLLDGVPGLVVPKTLRIAGANAKAAPRLIDKARLGFPVLLRRAGTHTGEFIGRFDDAEQVSQALISGADHVVTEFVDFRSGDGFYRKYRVFFFGGRMVFRHMLASDHWNVHAKDRTRFMADRPELVAEEERRFAGDGEFSEEVSETLHRVRERMGLDCFGIDFGIAPDGQAVLFEANATMNFFPFLDDPRFAYVKGCIEPAQRAMHALLDLPQPAPQHQDPAAFHHPTQFARSEGP